MSYLYSIICYVVILFADKTDQTTLESLIRNEFSIRTDHELNEVERKDVAFAGNTSTTTTSTFTSTFTSTTKVFFI